MVPSLADIMILWPIHPAGRGTNVYLSSERERELPLRFFSLASIKKENTELFLFSGCDVAWRAVMFFFFVLARKLSRRKSGGVMFFLCSPKLSRQKSGGSCQEDTGLGGKGGERGGQ